MFSKKFDRNVYGAWSPARTLSPADLGLQPSGWTILGEVQEDYYQWVNYFEAYHPDYGWVKGDFEDEVQAESEEAFNHFMEHHPYEEWDYGDI